VLSAVQAAVMDPSNTVLRNDDPDGASMSWVPLAREVAEASDIPQPLLNVGVLRSALSQQDAAQARKHPFPVMLPCIPDRWAPCCCICIHSSVTMLVPSPAEASLYWSGPYHYRAHLLQDDEMSLVPVVNGKHKGPARPSTVQRPVSAETVRPHVRPPNPGPGLQPVRNLLAWRPHAVVCSVQVAAYAGARVASIGFEQVQPDLPEACPVQIPHDASQQDPNTRRLRDTW